MNICQWAIGAIMCIVPWGVILEEQWFGIAVQAVGLMLLISLCIKISKGARGPTKEERAYGINLDTDLNPIIPPYHALAPDQGLFEQNDSPNKPKE